MFYKFDFFIIFIRFHLYVKGALKIAYCASILTENILQHTKVGVSGMCSDRVTRKNRVPDPSLAKNRVCLLLKSDSSDSLADIYLKRSHCVPGVIVKFFLSY